jgi:hypothetical protein
MGTIDSSFHTSDASSDALHHPIEALKTLVPPDTRRAVEGLPQRLRTEVQEHPYRTLGVALGLGVGIGIGIGTLASSRLTRFLAKKLGGVVAMEIARRGAMQYLEHALASH